MANTLERTYIVPLRKKTELTPEYKRAKKAVRVLREFIAKHMKCEDVRVGNYLNNFIWKDGIKNFPHHVEVKAIKETVKEDNKENTFVTVELLTLPKEAKKYEEKQKALKEIADKKKRKVQKEEVKEEDTEEQKEEKAVADAISKNEAPTKKIVRKKVQKEEEKKE